MKPWSNKVSAYRRQELSHPFKLGAVLLLQQTQLEEGNLNNLHAISGPLIKKHFESQHAYFCRYDSSKTFTQNVELTDPIISRFDVLCVVKVCRSSCIYFQCLVVYQY
jgi:hypothetical protein